VDDCINIFLGSAASYIQEQRHEPGTLYLTKGWIESGTPLDEQREIMASKYGEEKQDSSGAMLGRIPSRHAACPTYP
jgi:hypothetical protein